MTNTKNSKGRPWFAWLVIGLLGAHVAGMLIAVRIATGDHTFVALPDYYGKAIRWDQTQKESRQSDALGWNRTVSISSPDAAGNCTLHVRVTDAQQVGITGLKTSATVFPELHPNLSRDIAFRDDGDGSYSANFAPPSNGPLVIDLHASRNADTFVTRATLYQGSGS